METRLLTRCPSRECEFRTGLPVAVVDEELYQHPPSIVIGTIDKFAMLPWEPVNSPSLRFGAAATPATRPDHSG